MSSRDPRSIDPSLLAETPLPQVDVTGEGGTAALVAHARAGDRAALDILVRQEMPRVERLLRRVLGRRGDMEDLVQNVFVELFRALPGFRGESSLSTFVGGITIRVAMRAMRPGPWWQRRGEMPADVPTEAADPARASIANERLRRAHRALERLSPKKRVAFLMWALEGMDVDSIAEMTGASVSATRSRIFHAQRELREQAAQDPWLRELIGGEHAGS